MSSDLRVRAEGLGKDYVVGMAARGHTTLREQIVGLPARVARRRPPVEPQIKRAVADLTFDIRAGEVVGFIGHNGAGKSTLLKLLSRITAPTHGRAEVHGRVGSLLEVGTGFHSELTGRENIYLNGAILGMRKREIDARFDDIVEFADVAGQLDTPVKRYSSGQFVRLAFSVAAHLEPELLLVDEVLAVGDAAFQRRSIARMGEIARSGRTVLFVSHNMATVQAFCTRGIVLADGRAIADGPVDTAIAAYLRTLDSVDVEDLAEREDRGGRLEIRAVECTIDGGRFGTVATGGPARIDVRLSGLLPDTAVQLKVHDELGHAVCSFDSSVSAPHDVDDRSEPTFSCQIDELPLVEGRYRLDIAVRGRGGKEQDDVVAARYFDVVQGLVDGRPVTRDTIGRIAVAHRWHGPRQ